MFKREDIRIRDPFILQENGTYYMYGTTSLKTGIDAGNTFSVYISQDLEAFQEQKVVYEGEIDDHDFWAAEVHKYGGKYYMFASVVHGKAKRCSEIFVSDSPLGKFRYYADATPKDWTCLDATLYVENGIPYSVFCHEWTEVGVGEIWGVQLNEDLKGFAAPPKLLFNAAAASWVNVSENGNKVLCAVTDGPCLFRHKDKLIMLWSSFTKSNQYALGCSYANSIMEEWHQCEEPIFEQNGGHAMIFKNLQNKTLLSLHCPNDPNDERAVFTEFDYNLIAK